MDLTPFHGPPAAAPLVPGFVARTLLGFGTHGEVWLADDAATGKPVALKIGRRAADVAAASGDPPGPGPEHETALLCQIDHPHIVRLQRVVALPAGGVAMVLDLAAGGSLASLVAARGRFEPGEVSTLLVPLADALGHLHRRGVVHGDIAPGNVLFTGDGRPQLGDLGVGQVLGSRLGGTWATPGFTDPALTGSDPGEIDRRAADLWSLAAIGWFAFTGRPPEPVGAGPVGGCSARAADRAPALRGLLAQCLTAEPAARPSLQELADRAWRAARPAPIRLVPPLDHALDDPARADTGLPPLSERVTRPVPVVAEDSAAGNQDDAAGRLLPGDQTASWERAGVTRIREGSPPTDGPEESGRGAAARLRAGGSGRRRRAGIITGLAVATAVSGVVAAVTLEPGVLPVGRGSPQPEVVAAPLASSDRPAGPSPAATTGLEAELTRALVSIGHSRAVAFGRASERFLAGADVVGSPAYLADLALVQRLRAEGYRLQGVQYQVSGVRVLNRRGPLVEVRAVVTTSEHRQVRVGSGAAVAVPQDGPRPVLLTVAPVDLNLTGPGRWRVRSVAVPS